MIKKVLNTVVFLIILLHNISGQNLSSKNSLFGGLNCKSTYFPLGLSPQIFFSYNRFTISGGPWIELAGYQNLHDFKHRSSLFSLQIDPNLKPSKFDLYFVINYSSQRYNRIIDITLDDRISKQTISSIKFGYGINYEIYSHLFLSWSFSWGWDFDSLYYQYQNYYTIAPRIFSNGITILGLNYMFKIIGQKTSITK